MATPGDHADPLAAPITCLRGVGAERAQLLGRLGITRIGELLLHRPRRYEDRRKLVAIRELKAGEAATVRGKIIAAGGKNFRHGARRLFECVLDDGTAHLHLRWWRAQPWMENYFVRDREVLAFGKTGSLRPRTFEHPETEFIESGEDDFIHVNRIVPVHPLTEGITARVMRSLIWRALEHYAAALTEPEWERRLAAQPPPDLSPPSVVALDQWPRARAIRQLHFPDELADAEAARQRLALDEFVALQLEILSRRKRFEARAGARPCAGTNRLIKPFLAGLGFPLTPAQTRVLREIRNDMGGAHPMRRLLQGDVGSGKTVVAAATALMAVESGFNVALMAPTEILAAQHHHNFSRWFAPLGVPVALHTGANKTSARPAAAPSSHPAPPPTLYIGTHALVARGFVLSRLGLVVIDEQHKFGVAQREQLVRKGNYPHLLVMTATPIPRTLGLTLYGDLDLSLIDRPPAGRGAIKTFLRSSARRPQVWAFLRQQLRLGRQAYVVYPRVEDNADGLKAVTKEWKGLREQLAPFRIGLLHGRLKPEENERTMAGFRNRTLHVLLATSLIEVGVDVANASVMLIENAEAFGLSQLHQLRGRIGRGTETSYCILLSDAPDPTARERLQTLVETTDGFRIAEADLRLRGPGELLGQQQSGLPSFRFGSLADDLLLVQQARGLAAAVLATKD